MATRTRAVRIAGIGACLPERVIRSEELDAQFGLVCGSTAATTGVLERRYLDDETIEHMGACAARRALTAASIAASDVDVTIAAAASRRQLIPCTAVFVHRELGLPDARGVCFDVDATCLSWLVAVDIAAALIEAGRARVVLVVTSETPSRSLNRREPESAGLFGDAAVASVLTQSPSDSASRIGHVQLETYSAGADLSELTGLGTRHHPNDPATRPEMNLFHMRGRAMFKLVRQVFPPFIERFLDEAQVGRDGFDAVVAHQASRLGLQALTGQFGFPQHKVITNLATRGNCVAASLPLVLAEAVCSGRVRRGDRLLLLGAGAGITLGAMDMVF